MKSLRSMLVATAAAVLSGTMLAGPARAGVITFEGYADGTAFTTQDFGNGVTFAGATILQVGGSLNDLDFPPASGINVVFNDVGPMVLTFASAVDFFRGRFTYSLPLSIQAFDITNGLLGTSAGACAANYASAGCGAPNELIGVHFPGLISKVVVSGGGGNDFTLDNAEFTGSKNPGVPEPATTALLGVGLGSMVFVRRRRAAA